MTLAATARQSVANWISPKKREGTNPMAFHSMSAANWGPGMGHQPSDATLLNGSLGIADTATRAIAARVSTLNPLVKVKRRVRGGQAESETLHDHALKTLLDRPHPDFTRAMLFRLTAQWIITVGKAYWLKVGSRLQVPVELHPIPPGQVTPLLSSGVVTAYEVRNGDGKPTILDKSEVVRFYFPDPANPWASEGYLAPEGVTADSLNFAGQHLRSHYENDATPKTWIETDANAAKLTDPEISRFGINWRKRYHQRKGSDVGVPGIMPFGYKLMEMALQSGADIVPLLEFWRDEQLMGFGTPRSILGQSESGDRSTAETNQYVFDRHAVKPVANLIADGITLQLAPDFDPALFVEFEQFVSADKDFELKQEESRLRNKVIVIDEVREKDGMESVAWGDEPVATFADVPYRPDERFDLEDEETEPDEPDDAEDERTRVTREVSPEARSAWARQVNAQKEFKPPFMRALRKVFKAQRDDVLEKLEDTQLRAGHKSDVIERVVNLDTSRPVYSIVRVKRISVDDIFDPEEWVDDFVHNVEPIRGAAFVAVASDTMDEISDTAFVFKESVKKAVEDQGAEMIAHINETTRKKIAKQLHIAAQNGESASQIANRIRSVFKEATGPRARAIAKTEIGKASSAAQLEGFDQSGVVERKRWNHSLNPEGRPDHIMIDGQDVPVGEPFVIGDGELADAPRVGFGGIELSAGNTINCECFVTPVVGD